MPSVADDVKLRFGEKLHPKPDAVGYLGIPDGAGGFILDMPFRPGSLYARIQLGVEFDIAEVRAGAVPHDPYLKLNFFRKNGVLTAESPNADAAVASYGSNAQAAYLPPHEHSFTVGGSTGSNQTITTGGDPLVIAGLEGIATAGAATGKVNVRLSISTLTADTTPDPANDYVPTYDASAAVHKKVLLSLLAATRTLGNLASVAIAAHLGLAANNTYDLGSAIAQWRSLFTYAVSMATRSAPVTPAAGLLTLYAGTDKHPHAINEDGVDYDLADGGTGGSSYSEPLCLGGEILFLGGDVLMLGIDT